MNDLRNAPPTFVALPNPSDLRDEQLEIVYDIAYLFPDPAQNTTAVPERVIAPIAGQCAVVDYGTVYYLALGNIIVTVPMDPDGSVQWEQAMMLLVASACPKAKLERATYVAEILDGIEEACAARVKQWGNSIKLRAAYALYEEIAEALREGAGADRDQLHQIRELDPEVAFHFETATAGWMHPADWSSWYVSTVLNYLNCEMPFEQQEHIDAEQFRAIAVSSAIGVLGPILES